MRPRIIGLCLVVTFGPWGPLTGPASAAPPPAPKQEVAAQVNGKGITMQDLNDEFLARTRVPFERVQDNPQAVQARKQLLDQMINDELLVQQAERQKLAVPPEEVDQHFKNLQGRFPSEQAFTEALSSRGLTAEELKGDIKRGLLRQQLLNREIIEKVSVSPMDIESHFNAHKEQYAQEEKVHARHILIMVAPDAPPETDKKAKDRAQAVLAKAKKGEDFALLAAQNSEDTTKDRGGDLGYFERGRMVKSFEEAAFKLKVGEISDLVRTQFGYHIIKMEARQEAKSLPFTEVKDQVKQDLTRERARARYEEYIKGLRQKAKINVNLK
jgi:peptidyl-prolyl cis-trans isomerase C